MGLKNSGDSYSQADLDNHANQLNPNNDAYWQSRGEGDHEDDWFEEFWYSGCCD